VARFWVAGQVTRRFGEAFPWGTLLVNTSGAGLVGAIAGLLADAGPTVWSALVVGALGSYTTVSSFSLQTLALVRGGELRRAAWNVLGSVVLCLAAAAAGFALGRVLP
jgi:fluoride exporter